MTTTELLSALVTGILVLIFFQKFKGSIKKTDINRLPSARPEDMECVRQHLRNVSDSQNNAVAYNIREGNLIVAIKLVREAKNLGLKESKDLVESMKRQFK